LFSYSSIYDAEGFLEAALALGYPEALPDRVSLLAEEVLTVVVAAFEPVTPILT
jgi:hypothetical protein